MATMTAKYRGRCAISGAAILPRDVVRMPLVAVVAQFKRGNIMQTVLEFIAGIFAFFVMWAFLYVLLSF